MRSGVGPADHLRDHGIDVLRGPARRRVEPGRSSRRVDRHRAGRAPARPVRSCTRSRPAVAPGAGRRCARPDAVVRRPDRRRPATSGSKPVLLKPASRGSVRLRSSDPTAPPRITLPGVRAAADIARLVEAYRLGVALADRPEIRGLSSGPRPAEPSTPEALRETRGAGGLLDPARRRHVRHGTVARRRRGRRPPRPGPRGRRPVRRRRVDHPGRARPGSRT